MLEIKDQGPGIKEEDQQKIFQPFNKITSNASLNPKSNGLGLSICKGLSKKMGGNIEVFSDGMNGCTFRFTVALSPVVDLRELDEMSQHEARKRELGFQFSAKRLLK